MSANLQEAVQAATARGHFLTGYFSNIPPGIGCIVVQACGVRSVASIAAVSRTLKHLATSECASELVVQSIYPPESLWHFGYTSWRDLLMDDILASGVWCLELGAICNWRHNARFQFDQNRMQLLAYCQQTQTLHALVDAYGERDLRDASTTTLVWKRKKRSAVMYPESHRYLVKSSGNQVCVLIYSLIDHDEWLQPGAELCFVYNGGTARGTDYECASVLQVPASAAGSCQRSTMKRLFGTRGEAATDPVLDGRRRFMPLQFSYDMEASGAHCWELPQNILQRLNEGTWGN